MAIRSVLMQGGQGDVVMAAHGLQALLDLGVPALTADAACYTRSFVSPLIRIMLPERRVAVLGESLHCAHPRYATSSKTSWTTTLRNYFSQDGYVNFAARRRLASYGYRPPGWTTRLQQWMTDRKLAAGPRWVRETPAYYGLKMWAPLAEAWSVSEISLLRGLHLSYPRLSERVRSHARSVGRAAARPLAIFPGAAAFQYLPAAFLRAIVDALKLDEDQYACYFAPGDPSRDEYVQAGLACAVTHSLEELLSVMAEAAVTATADSFPSHLAQLVSPRHIALLAHDLPQHTVHPAAPSVVVFEPMPCCPCDYRTRRAAQTCPAGYAECGVFRSASYLRKAVQAFGQCLAG